MIEFCIAVLFLTAVTNSFQRVARFHKRNPYVMYKYTYNVGWYCKGRVYKHCLGKLEDETVFQPDPCNPSHLQHCHSTVTKLSFLYFLAGKDTNTSLILMLFFFSF